MTSTMMDDLTPNPTTAELINWAMEHALLAGKIGFKKAWESKAISGLTYLDAFDLQESDGRRVDRLPLKLVKEDNLYANLQRSLSEWNRERELYHFLSDNKSAFRRKDTMAELNIQLVAEGMSDADLEALSSAPLGVKLEELYLLKCKNEQARYIKGTFTDRLISQAPGTACPKALMIYLINDRLYPGDMRETIPISVPLITTFGMMVDVLNAYSTYNNWTVPTGISHGRGSGPAQSLTAGFDDGEIAAMDKAWCACLLEQSPKRFYSFSLDHLHQKFNPLFSEYRLSDDYNWSSLKRAMLRGGYPAVIWHESSVAAFEARIRATKTFQHLYGDIDRGRPRHIVKSIAQHLTASENAQITEDKGNTSLSPHRVGGAGNKGLNRRSNSLAPDWDRAVTMPWETSPFVARGSTAYVTGSASEPFNDIDMGDIYVHANNHLRVRDHTPAPSEMTFFDLSCIAPEQVPKPSIETSTISSTNNDISGSQRYKKRQPKESVTSNAPSSETVRLRPTLASEHSVSKSTLSRRYDSISSPSFGSSSLHSPATVIANKPNRGPTLDSGIASQTNSEDKNNAQSLRGSASHHRQQREEVNSTQVFNAPSVSLRSSSPPSSRKLSLSMSISPPSGLSQISAAGSSRPSVHSSRISSVIDWEESTAEKARLVSSWFHGRSPATRSPGYSNDASLQHPESGRRPELQNSALVVAESADSLEPFSTIYPAETTSTGRNRSDSSVGHRLKDSDSIDPRDEVFVKNLLKAAYEAYYPDVPFPVSLFERRDRPEPFSVLSNIVRLRQTRDVADLDMTDVSGVSDVSDKTPTVARPGDGPNKLNDAGTVSSLSKHHTASDGDAAGAATRTYTKTVVSANADGEKEVFYELELEHDRGEFSESLSNIDGSPMSSSDDEQGGVRTATVRTADATHSVHSVHSAHSIHDGETIHDGFERAERAERHESVERATDAEGDTPMTNYDYGDDDDENGHEDVKKQEAGKDGKATDEEADEKVDEEARFDEINDIIAEHFPAAEKGMAYRYDYDTADRLARNEKWAADETEWLDY